MKEHIDEMTKVLVDYTEKNHIMASHVILEDYAEQLYNAGYRKQIEGEWVDANPNGAVYKFTCTLCGETKLGKGTPYCPNCGAHMKGE